jgi:hypothetical protein
MIRSHARGLRKVRLALVAMTGLLSLLSCTSGGANTEGFWTWRSGVHSEWNHPVADSSPLVLFHADDYTARRALMNPGVSEIVFVNCHLTDAAFRDISVHNPGLTRVEFRIRDEVSPLLPEREDEEIGLPDAYRYYRGVTSQTLAELAKLPHLRHLVLLVDTDASGMGTLFESATRLESLLLYIGYEVRNDRLLRSAHLCTSLKSLHVKGFHEQDIGDIARCHGLEKLILESGPFRHESLLSLANLTNLRSLTLDDGVGDTLRLFDDALVAILKANPHLEELSIFGGYDAEGTWVSALRHVPRLRRLSLIFPPAEFAGVSPEIWETMPMLEELTLASTSTSISPSTANLSAADARAIAALPRLRRLALDSYGEPGVWSTCFGTRTSRNSLSTGLTSLTTLKKRSGFWLVPGILSY